MPVERHKRTVPDIIARLRSAGESGAFTLTLDGGGIPGQQKIMLEQVVMVHRQDIDDVIEYMENSARIEPTAMAFLSSELSYKAPGG